MGKPLLEPTQPYARIFSSIGSDEKIILLSRFWKYLADLFSFSMDFDRGKPLPCSVEPQVGFNTYARRIGWGHPQPRSL
jgi:hypothetical protein